MSFLLFPASLHNVCLKSLQLIENASSSQIEAAIKCNQSDLNKLFAQLLALNFLCKNQNEIENDLNIDTNNTNNNKKVNNLTSHVASKPLHEPTLHGNDELEHYCERKLLSLSPILGFSRKNYFVECNVNDDNRMEILSYLKPIEIFKNVSLINKQFNKNVKTIHQSYKHANMFCNKNFVFKSLEELDVYRSNYGNKVDWKIGGCRWVCGSVQNLVDGASLARVRANVSGTNHNCQVECTNIAPLFTMTCRPGNISRFVNILKRGYCSATCDVNLKNFYVEIQPPHSNSDSVYLYYRHIIDGSYSDYTNHRDRGGECNGIDTWRCGWIDFGWTWYEATKRGNQVQQANKQEEEKEKGQENEKEKEKEKEKQKRKNTKFPENSRNINDSEILRVFQVSVNVDITKEYNNHDEEVRLAIRKNKFLRWRRTDEDKYVISVTFHIDDIENFTYFGNKTTLEQQLKTKEYIFNHCIQQNRWKLCKAKAKLLLAVGYPNFCIVTQNGTYCAISEDKEEREKFQKAWNAKVTPKGVETEVITMQLSQNGIKKVHYDKTKDELLIKIVPWFKWILVDKNAPEPLEKRYYLQHGNRCRLIEAKIVDPKLIDKVRKENINDVNKKEKRYFELLKEWKGFIQVSIDLTKEFDQFQERLKKDYFMANCACASGKVQQLDMMEWDNRKYFLQKDYLNYDSKMDRITRNVYILLDSNKVYNFNEKFNFFHVLKEKTSQERQILTRMFNFLCDYDIDGNLAEFENRDFVLVCKKWYRVDQDNRLS